MDGWPDHADPKEQKKLKKRIAGIKNNLEMLVGDVAGIFGKGFNLQGRTGRPGQELPQYIRPGLHARPPRPGRPLRPRGTSPRWQDLSAYAAAEQAGFLLKMAMMFHVYPSKHAWIVLQPQGF